jgi:hypothetical protein
MSDSGPHRLDRRTALKWIAASAGVAFLRPRLSGADPAAAPNLPVGSGYGTDPDLLRDYKPGDLWPLTFSDSQRRAAAALCALIIPADAESPGAADLLVHDFIDEWISAPYPAHSRDRDVILEGLVWIDAEARRRFERDFADLDEARQSAIADDICNRSKAAPEFESAAGFFARFRDLCGGGYYSTPEGMRAIGYVGNMPLEKFEGPPRELLVKLGLA